MKTKNPRFSLPHFPTHPLSRLLAVLLALLAISPLGTLAAEPVIETFQKALFEEEANQNYDVAIRAYLEVIGKLDEQRKLAATAIFRLGECYRKLGRTNDAVAQYDRLLAGFADQTNLLVLARQNLSGLGILRGMPEAARTLQSAAQMSAEERSKLKDPSLNTRLQGIVGRASDISLTDEEEKELKQIKSIIRDSPDLINAKAKSEISRLQNAASDGQVKVAEFLLANGADVNANLRSWGTPLHLAAQNGHKTMTELLLKHGAEVNNRVPGGTPLHFAVENGHRAVAEVLLANGADLNIKGNGRAVTGDLTPLHMAAFKGFTTIAELLLAKGAPVDSVDRSGQTPLHYAATYRHLRIAQLLLTNKADVNLRSEEGRTPLHEAASHNVLPIASLLLENGAKVNTRIERGTYKGFTPLLLAAESADRAMTELFLAHRAEVNVVTPSAQTALLLAASKKKSDVVELLLAAGADVNARLENRQTALGFAVVANDEPTVSKLLVAKPDLEFRDERNLTVLQQAVINNQENILELLLRAGANPNLFYHQDGNTPLHWAVEAKRKSLVKLLLANKADVNARNNNSRTPLDLTKSGSSPRNSTDQAQFDDIAVLLKEAGADEQMQRRTSISISRRSREYLAPWFVQGSNTWNRFTLLELLASVYAQSPPVTFPDFARITINRLGSAGSKSTEIAVDVDALFRSNNCSNDVPLVWGDVVEIPERDRKLNENWTGLPGETTSALKKCLERNVEVMVKGEMTKLTLVQNFNYHGGSPQSAPQWSMFWLSSALRNGNLLRASSDLRRVNVRRIEPSAVAAQEILLNAERSDPRSDLWLQDGDVIEVPDRPPGEPASAISAAPPALVPAARILRPSVPLPKPPN